MPCGRRKRFRPEPGIKRRLERPERTDGEDHAQHTECPADGRVEERKGAYEGPGEEEEQRNVEQPGDADLEHPGDRVSFHALVPLHARDHALAGRCSGERLAILGASDPAQGHVRQERADEGRAEACEKRGVRVQKGGVFFKEEADDRGERTISARAYSVSRSNLRDQGRVSRLHSAIELERDTEDDDREDIRLEMG